MRRICWPMRVPPGSMVSKTSLPPLRKRSPKRRICVLLPLPSIPSKVMNFPRTGIRKFHFPTLWRMSCETCSSANSGTLTFSHGLDQRFHVIQVFFERPASGGSQAVFGARQPPFERFRAGDVMRVFEFARVHAQIAVRGLEQLLQLVERQRF